MQWNGVRPNPDRPAPLRSLMEILQQKAEPYVTQYGENQIPGAGQLLNSIMRTGTEMVPGVGDLLGAEDLQTAAQNNDWAGIGLGALAAIPGIPAFGRGVRGEARAARGVANTVADAVSTNQPMTEAEAALARYRAANPNDTGARVLSPGDQGYPTNAQWDEASQAYVAPVEPDYPIRAYHGSPHSFDRFSLDKIGTGEGAQAYGHGLYFAENENVARSYRDQLSNWTADGKGLGKKLSMDLGAFGGDLDALMASRMEQLANWTAQDPNHFITRDLQRDVAELEALKAKTLGSSGSMYEVGINADPSTFLDWDRPLSEQPAIAERLGVDPSANARRAAEIRAAVADDMRMSGRSEPDSIDLDRIRLAEEMDALDATGNASSYAPRSQEQLEEMLARGISGIRYLDGSSRSAIPPTIKDGASGLEVYWGNDPTPVGTYPTRQEAEEAARQLDTRSRNYVVFNDELVKILRKYGISGLSTTVGASALAEELDRRGQTQEF